jgi:hypothetical protein
MAGMVTASSVYAFSTIYGSYGQYKSVDMLEDVQK